MGFHNCIHRAVVSLDQTWLESIWDLKLSELGDIESELLRDEAEDLFGLGIWLELYLGHDRLLEGIPENDFVLLLLLQLASDDLSLKFLWWKSHPCE